LNARGNDTRRALALYRWNAQISSAVLFPLQICEVFVRNGIVEAIENAYGPRWPWEPAFQGSLPNPSSGFSPRQEITNLSNRFNTVGAIVAELKFAFWVSMFTRRHQTRIWDPIIFNVFSGSGMTDARNLRSTIYRELDAIRKFRNRVAHHEPIFSRPPGNDFNTIMRIISWRCPVSEGWVRKEETVSQLLARMPT